MNDDPYRTPQSPPTEVVIPKENAVFWMDGRGRWHNRHGRFAHKRIIDHFNRAIRRDENGYYLTQIRGSLREKVYFNFEDTPLFAIDIIVDAPLRLVLNTGEAIHLNPQQLFIESDQLYQRRGDERIKFIDRALIALSPYLQETANGLAIRMGHRVVPIPEV
jgi:hypothetical protein